MTSTELTSISKNHTSPTWAYSAWMRVENQTSNKEKKNNWELDHMDVLYQRRRIHSQIASISPSMARYSPLVTLPKQTLTESGLLALDSSDSEVQLITRSFIELRSLSPNPLPVPASATTNIDPNTIPWSDRDRDLTVTVTTHRIVFQTKSSSHFLHHCAVLPNEDGVQATGGGWTSNRSYKIHLQSITHGDFYMIFRSGQKDRDAVFKQLSQALKRRQWEEAYNASTSVKMGMHSHGNNQTSYQTTSVGIDAILKRNQDRHDRAKKLTQDAFGKGASSHKHKVSKDDKSKEVETLFREAKELTAIIHKYVATLEKDKRNQSNGDEGEDTTELTDMLQDMGMITALTKKSAGDQYHELLARQISDFLKQNRKFSIRKGGCGIMTLTDVYCLYNRARGANMISPEDLLEALGQMEALKLGMKLREFEDTHVKVLQETGFDDSVMSKKLLEYIDEKEKEKSKENITSVTDGFKAFFGQSTGMKVYVGVTALEAARVLKISPILANEQLLSAERSGYLCRDVTVEGTRFFRNLFV